MSTTSVRSVALALIGLAACSQGAPRPLELPPAQVSGSRLRARFLSGPGGVRVPLGWMDTQLGTPCTFQTAEDGAIRCLPDPAIVYRNGVTFYSDAACSAPAVDAPPACAAVYGDPPAFIADATLMPTRYLPVTAKLPAGTQAYILKPDCIASQSLQQGFAVGPAVAPAVFAEAHVAAPTGTSRLQILTRTTDDGAQEPIGIADTMRGGTCSPQVAGDGALRCLPDAAAPAYYYADPGCSRAAVRLDPGATAPVLGYTVAGGSCLRRRIYALGTPMTLSTIYLQQADTCLAIMATDDYVVGDEIAPTEFEALSYRDAGAGRIRERVLVDTAAEVVARGYAWVDTQLRAAVHAESVDGQSYALVPAAANPPLDGVYYSDTACTESTPLSEVPPEACAALPPPRYLVTPATTLPTCSPPQVLALGAPVSRAQLFSYASGTGTCEKLTATDDPQLRPAGAPVDPSSFLTVTVSTE